MSQVKLVFIALVVITLFTYTVVNIIPIYAQNGGLRMAPVIKWTDNKEVILITVFIKGMSLGTNIDNLKKYCLVATENPSLNNMYAYLDDGVDMYHLDDIVVPPNVIRDGQSYTVCVGFNPQSEADYSIAESCESFYNTQGSHVETPLINLDRDACYDCD